jgi:hypothetical protein
MFWSGPLAMLLVYLRNVPTGAGFAENWHPCTLPTPHSPVRTLMLAKPVSDEQLLEAVTAFLSGRRRVIRLHT